MTRFPFQRVIRNELTRASSQKLQGKIAGVSPQESLGTNRDSFVPGVTGTKMAGVSSQELLGERCNRFVASSYCKKRSFDPIVNTKVEGIRPNCYVAKLFPGSTLTHSHKHESQKQGGWRDMQHVKNLGLSGRAANITISLFLPNQSGC